MRKQSFIAIAAVTIGLFAVPLASASAGDENSGYNTSDTDTVTIGSDPNTGGPTQQDVDTMQQIQQGTQELKDSHSGDSEGADSGSDSDSGSGDDSGN